MTREQQHVEEAVSVPLPHAWQASGKAWISCFFPSTATRAQERHCPSRQSLADGATVVCWRWGSLCETETREALLPKPCFLWPHLHKHHGSWDPTAHISVFLKGTVIMHLYEGNFSPNYLDALQLVFFCPLFWIRQKIFSPWWSWFSDVKYLIFYIGKFKTYGKLVKATLTSVSLSIYTHMYLRANNNVVNESNVGCRHIFTSKGLNVYHQEKDSLSGVWHRG